MISSVTTLLAAPMMVNVQLAMIGSEMLCSKQQQQLPGLPVARYHHSYQEGRAGLLMCSSRTGPAGVMQRWTSLLLTRWQQRTLHAAHVKQAHPWRCERERKTGYTALTVRLRASTSLPCLWRPLEAGTTMQ